MHQRNIITMLTYVCFVKYILSTWQYTAEGTFFIQTYLSFINEMEFPSSLFHNKGPSGFFWHLRLVRPGLLTLIVPQGVGNLELMYRNRVKGLGRIPCGIQSVWESNILIWYSCFLDWEFRFEMIVWIVNLAGLYCRLSNLFTWSISGVFKFGKKSEQNTS